MALDPNMKARSDENRQIDNLLIENARLKLQNEHYRKALEEIRDRGLDYMRANSGKPHFWVQRMGDAAAFALDPISESREKPLKPPPTPMPSDGVPGW